MRKYRCLACGEEFTVEDGADVVCPLCGADGDNVELIENDKEDMCNNDC